MNVALCGVDEKTACELERCGEYRILRFFDEPERRGDVKLAYYLRDGPPGMVCFAAWLLSASSPTDAGSAAYSGG